MQTQILKKLPNQSQRGFLSNMQNAISNAQAAAQNAIAQQQAAAAAATAAVARGVGLGADTSDAQEVTERLAAVVYPAYQRILRASQKLDFGDLIFGAVQLLRSQPMIKSKLRRPTSKSTTAVLKPLTARPIDTAALVVVFPTPPLPDVTTIISADLLPAIFSL